MRLLIQAILLGCALFSGSGLGAADSMLSLADAAASPGQGVVLPLSLSSWGNQVSGLEWTLAYSTADFSAISVSIGSAADSVAKNLYCNSPTAGQYTCLVIGNNQSLIGNGVVATATLTVSSSTTSTSSSIFIATPRSSTPSGSEDSVSGAAGVVTVAQPGTLSDLTCAPIAISPPEAASCTVSLDAAAPNGGITVALGYVNSGATVSMPSSVMVAAGTSQTSFSVQALNASSSTSATITANLNSITKSFSLGIAPETTPPTAPANPSAAAVSTSQINLSWTASTDNTGVTGYLVERCQGSPCTNFVQIATPTATTHNDTGLASNVAYRYRVRARDAAGNQSLYSTIVSATTLLPVSVSATPPIASLFAGQTQQFTATVTGGSGNTGVIWTRSPSVGSISATGLYTAPASVTTQQTVTVTATSAADSSKSDSVAITLLVAPDIAPPTAPANASATAVSTSQINLSWTASTDNTGVTGYLVERCQGPACLNFAQVATPTTTTYDDTGLAPKATYRYRVRARDAAGNQGSYSAIVSAATSPKGKTRSR